MGSPASYWRLLAVFASALLAAGVCLGEGMAPPKHVLIVHSYGRDFAPSDEVTSVFRAELARISPTPIAFAEANLDAGRKSSEEEGQAFLDYLRARFAGGAPDVVVTIGLAAARFYVAHRSQLFPDTPLVVVALDVRLAREAVLRPNDASVASKIDFPFLIEHILRVLPDTKTIAVVIGASAMERYWRQLQADLAPFKGRVNFLWLNDLSLEQLKGRLANLPATSAIFYNLFVVDAAGVPQERQHALADLHAVANAPIFGLYETELGKGVVGGPYVSQWRHGDQIAAAVDRILRGIRSGERQIQTIEFETPVYDWRELHRWNIEPARLPPGSEVRFQPPSL